MESNSLNAPQISPKRRILFVITLNEIGGAQKFVKTLVDNLDFDKYEISVAVGDNSTGDFLRLFKPPVQIFLIKNLKRKPNVFSDILTIFEIRRLIKKTKSEIIFLNSSKAGFIGSLATIFPNRIKNIKVIYRIGGWTFNDPWPKLKKWFWIQLEKRSAKWKDVIVVNNNGDLEQAKKLKIKPKEGLVLIHNGLDVYKINFLPKEEARLKLFEKIAKNSGKIFQIKYIVGCIANFYPTKAIQYFIESAKSFKDNPDIAFVVIGDGEQRSNYELLIANYGLKNKVFLIGQVKDAYRYLTAFDIFVLPSVKEGFPWALIEAMSAKLPVIATCVGAVPEIIENGKNGFIVESRNPDQITKKINNIIEDDRLRQELGIQAHQTVLFKFSLDKMISKFRELL